MSGRSLYSEFPDKGNQIEENFHHLTFDLGRKGIEQAIAALQEGGIGVMQDAMNVVRPDECFTYLSTGKVGGAIFKLRHRPMYASLSVP